MSPSHRVPDGELSSRTKAGMFDPVSSDLISPFTVLFGTFEISKAFLGRAETVRDGRKVELIANWSMALLCYMQLLRAWSDDNPYADMMLLELEADLASRREAVRYRREAIMSQTIDGIESGEWKSSEICLALNTGNAHARILARFAVELDGVAKLEKQQNSIGAITVGEASSRIKGYQKQLRQAINRPIYLQRSLLKVTRADFEAATPPENLSLMRKRLDVEPVAAILSKALQPQNVPVDLVRDGAPDSADEPEDVFTPVPVLPDRESGAGDAV